MAIEKDKEKLGEQKSLLTILAHMARMGALSAVSRQTNVFPKVLKKLTESKDRVPIQLRAF